jgi:hypothetical protein
VWAAAHLVDLLHLTRLARLAHALAAVLAVAATAATATRLALALGLLGLVDVLAGAGVAQAAAAGVEVAADLHREVAAAGRIEARVLLAVAEAAAVAEFAVATLGEGEALRTEKRRMAQQHVLESRSVAGARSSRLLRCAWHAVHSLQPVPSAKVPRVRARPQSGVRPGTTASVRAGPTARLVPRARSRCDARACSCPADGAAACGGVGSGLTMPTGLFGGAIGGPSSWMNLHSSPYRQWPVLRKARQISCSPIVGGRWVVWVGEEAKGGAKTESNRQKRATGENAPAENAPRRPEERTRGALGARPLLHRQQHPPHSNYIYQSHRVVLRMAISV